jgi:hypothetical protein
MVTRAFCNLAAFPVGHTLSLITIPVAPIIMRLASTDAGRSSTQQGLPEEVRPYAATPSMIVVSVLCFHGKTNSNGLLSSPDMRGIAFT